MSDSERMDLTIKIVKAELKKWGTHVWIERVALAGAIFWTVLVMASGNTDAAIMGCALCWVQYSCLSLTLNVQHLWARNLETCMALSKIVPKDKGEPDASSS